MDLTAWTCCTDSQDLPWWAWLVVGGFVGGLLIFILTRVIAVHRSGTTLDPLPRLTEEPVSAMVQAIHPAPLPAWSRRHTSRIGRLVDWYRGLAPAAAHEAYVRSLMHDAWLVEVEYATKSGERVRACLADVIPGSELPRFTVGADISVRCFESPRTRLRADAAAGAPATMRCMLADSFTDMPRAGYDLDGVRVRVERVRWSEPWARSPFFGIMEFKTEHDPSGGKVGGERRSFPATPQDIWAGMSQPAPVIRGAEPAPRPESVHEVRLWEDSDSFARTELIFAPIFWVCLPVAAIGLLWFLTVNDSSDAGPDGFFWVLWVAVFVWLLVSVGVLVHRFSIRKEDLVSHERIYRHGVLCTLHRAPWDRSGGEGDSSPTFIALDSRLDDRAAARIHRAFHTWILAVTAVDTSCLDEILPAEQLFGREAQGGWYLPFVSGFGTAEDFAAHQWVLVTAPEDPEAALPIVTTVPQGKAFRRMRAKARRQIERSRR
ncbi:hypothetical protein [Paramicrobacterium chengjingii]|uniref:DUF2207 domain-containing protein n=1 Tax=Paramicrobacterium chengjingii TaxID=2769067 RepID=A0ABX6YHU2_9MICO|nr:hypothetical protein [Microbacterium chengjingii]QPZ37981.1 hypothetical protein HCR76_14410 [Microbacterium chengjingii]